MAEVRPYGPKDARREAAVEMLKLHVRRAGIDTDYDADIEYIEHALLAFADEWLEANIALVLEDDEAMRRARHAYLNSPPHGAAHNGPARLAHMRAAVSAAFSGGSRDSQPANGDPS